MKYCKICFKQIKENSILPFINTNLCLCRSCYEKLVPHFMNFKVGKYSALALYEYDENIRSLLYQFKGCFDYELKEVFFDRYIREMRLIYLEYYIVPIPSYINDDKTRGFNHVEELFNFNKKRMLKLIEKTDHFKQADHNKEQRGEIIKHLKLIDENIDLSRKKILIVDDVYSTGSTMKAAIQLVEKLHPKSIKVLVMSKTNDDKYKKEED